MSADETSEQPIAADARRETQFERDLASLLNRYCRENQSDTPDFILAEYLISCLESWNFAVVAREMWYGRQAGNGAAILSSDASNPPGALR